MWENRAMRPTPRMVFGVIVLAVAGLIASGIFYFQEYLGLDPCPMCILSRYLFITIAAIALVAALHGPRGGALKGYAAVIVVLALAGIGLSAWHSYLQVFPPKVETCGTDLEFLLNAFPISQALPKIFAGTGSCSSIQWRLLGLTIPMWAGVWYAIFAALALWAGFLRDRAR
jgi:disulfide bond formation protein DsbB